MPIPICPIPAVLLAACLFTAGIHSKAQEVKQTPPSASLVEGDSVTMNCIIDFIGPKIYKWLKNDLQTDQAISMYGQRVEEGMKDSKGQKLLPFLRIKNLTECDSGTYYCAAENLGRTLKGAGTKLTVTRVPQSAQCNSVSYIYIGVSAAVIGVLCISLIIVSVRLIQRNKACIALQRQFVAYITEKSAETVASKPKGKHQHRTGTASSSGVEGKKKRKQKERHTVDNANYVHIGRPEENQA
ncbi:uncharacterized protein LOC121291731 isoform X1 [Carcharodon carcharias]|uniref:uncharacterized protein LOC121291731 isoform X1 n=2 Tax=Carcharodon carcharias TaxID=13397 RepID=UPI001B7E118C|nr:uncharacterized protein LOC121291731 isoform X1 [Carcharodon carcharias]